MEMVGVSLVSVTRRILERGGGASLYTRAGALVRMNKPIFFLSISPSLFLSTGGDFLAYKRVCCVEHDVFVGVSRNQLMPAGLDWPGQQPRHPAHQYTRAATCTSLGGGGETHACMTA